MPLLIFKNIQTKAQKLVFHNVIEIKLRTSSEDMGNILEDSVYFFSSNVFLIC